MVIIQSRVQDSWNGKNAGDNKKYTKLPSMRQIILFGALNRSVVLNMIQIN